MCEHLVKNKYLTTEEANVHHGYIGHLNNTSILYNITLAVTHLRFVIVCWKKVE